MPYRDEREALNTRHRDLAHRLEFLRERRAELERLARETPALERELADVRRTMEGLERQRSLPVLEQLHIAAPCDASWDAMQGDDRVRFCGSCSKNVYNLSSMARDEAESLVRANEGNLCVRYFKRADGTVLTTDCTVGVRRRRRRRFVALAGAGALATSALATAFVHQGAPTRPVGAVETHGLTAMTGAVAVPTIPEPHAVMGSPPVVVQGGIRGATVRAPTDAQPRSTHRQHPPTRATRR